MTAPSGLPKIHRFATDHDDSGKAIFHKGVPALLNWETVNADVKFTLAYTTDRFPVDLNNNADIKSYQHYQKNLPGISIPGGTVLRIVDMPPGAESPMHRTVSLDFGVVLEGSVEARLDSGESRILQRGDVVVQRGTNHLWKNVSETEWSRMLYVLQEAVPLTVNGKNLEEDYGGVSDARPSKG